jgi:hypothetical protein
MRPINYVTTRLWHHSISDVDIPQVPQWLNPSHHVEWISSMPSFMTDCSPIALLLAPWSAKFYDTVYSTELFILTEMETDCSGRVYSHSLMSLSNVDSENWNLRTVSITLIIIGRSVSRKLMERGAKTAAASVYGDSCLTCVMGGKWSLYGLGQRQRRILLRGVRFAKLSF